MTNKIIIGRDEWCSFPSLGIGAIKARVDSGAKTSAIHAFNINSFKRKGENWVSFEVHPLQGDRKTVLRCECQVVDKRVIRSSNGEKEKRIVVRVPMVMGGNQWDVDLTLTNRDSMGFRMLLGREAMDGRLVVDPSLDFQMGEYSASQLNDMYQSHCSSDSSGLTIALLASNPNLYSNKRLIEAAEERGHHIHFVDVEQCYMKLDSDSPKVYSRGGHILETFDAVIPRLRLSLSKYGCSLLRQFQNAGSFCLNSPEYIVCSRDKVAVLQTVMKHGVTVPTSYVALSTTDPQELVEAAGRGPLRINMLSADKAQYVASLESAGSAESVINALASFGVDFMVQQPVISSDNKKLRCFIVDGKIVASIEKSMLDETHAKNHLLRAPKITKLSADERKMTLLVAKVLGLDVVALDFIRTQSGPVLLDITACAGLEDVETATGKDIAGLYISAIEKNLGWKRAIVSSSPVAQPTT